MNPYQAFAQVYDQFMSDMPTEVWIAFIERLWARYSLKPDLILDIGCGTGALSLPLAQKGYGIIGIDMSEDMLSFAQQKAQKMGVDALFLQQDMRKFELYGSVDSVICICDVINYLCNTAELKQFFNLVYTYLNPGGLLIFDISTEYKFSQIFADNDFCGIGDNAAYIWENSYDPAKLVNEYRVTFFIKKDDKYERFEELHSLKAFSVTEVKSALVKAGFLNINLCDANGFGSLSNNSERIFFSAQK